MKYANENDLGIGNLGILTHGSFVAEERKEEDSKSVADSRIK